MSWGGNALQLCVRQPLSEKGIWRFPWQLIPTAGATSCDWGHFKSTRREIHTPRSFGACKACRAVIGPFFVGGDLPGSAFGEAWKGWGRISLWREAGLDPRRGTPVCVEVEGGCEHPSPAAPASCPRWLRGSAGVTRSHLSVPRAPSTSRARWKKEALSMKHICWGCCRPFIPSLFIKLGPSANIFSPTVNKHEIFPSLQLKGPLATGSGELSALAGRGVALQRLQAGTWKTLPSPLIEKRTRFHAWSNLSGFPPVSTPSAEGPDKMSAVSPAHPGSPGAAAAPGARQARAVWGWSGLDL